MARQSIEIATESLEQGLLRWRVDTQVRARVNIYEQDGTYVRRGTVGTVVDFDFDDYLIVEFPEPHGAVICTPDELR